MCPAPKDFAPLTFSSSDIPERERLPFWREFFARKIVHVDVEMLSSNPLEAMMTSYPLPGLAASEGKFVSPMRMKRTLQIFAEGDDSFALFIRQRGNLSLSQGKEEASLGKDGIGAAGITHAEPAMAVFSDYAFWNLVVPRRDLAPLVGDVEKVAMRAIPQDNEALRLLRRYLAILRRGPLLQMPELRRLAAVHVHDLIALALGATRDGEVLAARRGLRAARLASVKNDILENLADPDLSIAAVAHRQRITPHYIHLLFELEGLTYSEYVLAHRLLRAYRMLSDLRFSSMTISAIAFAVGRFVIFQSDVPQAFWRNAIRCPERWIASRAGPRMRMRPAARGKC
jgi:AraC-like DNA-binding protein